VIEKEEEETLTKFKPQISKKTQEINLKKAEAAGAPVYERLYSAKY
jgi:hypothetical protein